MLMVYDINSLLPNNSDVRAPAACPEQTSSLTSCSPRASFQPDKLASLVLFQMESAEEDDEALAVVVEGAAKLMLSGALTDETVRAGLFRPRRTSS